MKTRKILSLALAVALALSLSVSAMASAPSEGTSNGDSTVTLPTLTVTVPTNLNFALDPLKMSSSTQGQVTSGNYFLSNSTAGVRVLASFYLTAVAVDGVNFVEDPTDIASPGDLTIDRKDIALGVIGALTAGTTATTLTYGTSGSAVVYFDEDQELSFGLLLAPATGTSGFSFTAKMQAYAGWKANDVKVSGVYTLKAISTNAELAPVLTVVTDSLNMIEASEIPPRPLPVGFLGASKGANAHTSAVQNVSKAASTTTLPISFNAGGKAITVKTSSGTVLAIGTGYNYEAATNTLTILNERLTAYRGLAVGTNVVLNITIAGDSTTYVLNFTIVT